MTRKQALLAVLETATDTEAIAVIQDMIENMPFHEWDAAAIDDAIEQYKFDHGHYPKPCNFRDDRRLPNASTVLYRTKEEWLKIFQSEFDRIHPKSANDFNVRRDKSTPTWNVVAEMFGTKKMERAAYGRRT